MASIIKSTTTDGIQIIPDSTGAFAIQTNGANTALTIDTSQNATFAKNIILNGSTSGTVTLAASAVSGTTTLTLPSTSGTLITTATGQTLTSPVIAGTPTGVGVLTSGTAVASTSGTSIDFTGIPSWVKLLTIMFQGVSSNGSSNFLVQIGAGSVTSSGYLGAGSNSAIGTVNFTAGFGTNLPNSTSSVTHGALTLFNLNSNSWVASGTFARSDAAGNGTTTGSITLGGTLDRVRITTVNGTDTFDAGTINILYE